MFSGAPAGDSYDVYNVRVEALATGKARIVLETTGDVQYRDVFSHDPDRLTVDLMSARLSTPTAAALVARGGVREIQLSQTSNEVVRMVIDFEDVDNYSIYEQGNDLTIAFDNAFGDFPEYDMTGGAGRQPAVAEAAPAEATAAPGSYASPTGESHPHGIPSSPAATSRAMWTPRDLPIPRTRRRRSTIRACRRSTARPSAWTSRTPTSRR